MSVCFSFFFLFSFSLDDLSNGESEVLKFQSASVWGLICNLSYSTASFTKECLLMMMDAKN